MRSATTTPSWVHSQFRTVIRARKVTFAAQRALLMLVRLVPQVSTAHKMNSCRKRVLKERIVQLKVLIRQIVQSESTARVRMQSATQLALIAQPISIAVKEALAA